MKATKVSRIAAGALSALLLSGTLFACSKEPDEASSAVSETSQSAGAIFTEHLGAVSYTHLDVYKRQAFTYPLFHRLIHIADRLCALQDGDSAATFGTARLLSLIHI